MCKICTQASPEGCARFYAIWCLAWGTFLTVFWGFLLGVAIFGATLPDDQQPKSLQQKYRPYRTSRYDDDKFERSTNSPEVNRGMLIATTSLFLIVHLLYILAGALMCLGMNRVSQLIKKYTNKVNINTSNNLKKVVRLPREL